MLVGDLIYNDNFDCNCNYKIYDCTEKGSTWNDGGKLVFSTEINGYKKPLDTILDMEITYITTDNNAIIIEAKQK